ncbi:MAG: TlyA family RNA methyltransferase, partial [Methylobacteriaceae bacterium]|nr:TlyA family RNA methyltransferase [Methylobacteriaceae bacterium]
MSARRADLALVARGFYESRARARAAIEAGLVEVDGALLSKPSQLLPDSAAVTRADAPHPYVSRGGVKLAAALDAFGFDPAGRLCLDVGASTGGFTDALLRRGAARVVAVDVGHGQLHASLAADPRVVSREGLDARALTPADLGAPPSLIVCDASFISLTLLLPVVLPLAAPDAALVALVKP